MSALETRIAIQRPPRQLLEVEDGALCKVPARIALGVAEKFVQFLKPHCAKILVAGSLRRRKQLVSDIEILFIPRFLSEKDPGDLFGATRMSNATERAIAALLAAGVLTKRPNVNGVDAWGAKNKLGVHAATGIGVDLFTATPENWPNYLVCRTGGAENNVRICNAAIACGWKWNPYGDGFSRVNPAETHVVQSEREVFGFVGLPYLEPWER
jgi:DNA polymerase/3'-5' exonuclease PolX